MPEYWIDSNHTLQGPKVIEPGIFLPEAKTQAKIEPWSIILHSQAGPRSTSWRNLFTFWQRKEIDGEAHFIVNLDGTIKQAMPCNVKADCNFKANSFRAVGKNVGAISFETQDLGSASLPNTPWNAEQLDTLTKVIAAVGHKYGVPYTQPATWNDRGVGHHSLYKEWSSFVGKTCPGAARIRQMDYVRTTAAGICAC
jgi:hypothetical protein